MRIGITDTLKEDKFEQYVQWIHLMDESIEIVKLSHLFGNASEICGLDGLILSGGGDVHPRYYGKENQLHKTIGVNEDRDEFEFNLIEKALENDMPVLGVCRGMQVMNVYLGGSLIVDLISEGFGDHTSVSDEIATLHKVNIETNTLLSAFINAESAEVNSFHHQSVGRLGRGLVCSAISDDGVIEAAEWVVKDNMPYLMLVQWHPERKKESLLSQKIARIFLREARQIKTIK